MIYTQKSAEGSGRMTGDMSNTVDVNNKSRIERGGAGGVRQLKVAPRKGVR